MAGHLRRGVRIADFVLQSLAGSSGNLQKRPVIPLQEDEKRRTPFQLCRPLFIAIGERRRNRGVQLRNALFQRRLDLSRIF